MHTSTVDFEAMKAKLFPLSKVEADFSATEPLSEVTFTTGQSLAVAFAPDADGKEWHDRPGTEAAPAWLKMPGSELFQFTAEAAMQLGSRVGMPDGWQRKQPAKVLNVDLNYWLREGMPDTEMKLLTHGTGKDLDGNEVPLVQAVCRPSTAVFSNLKFLEIMTTALHEKYGAGEEILVDYKFHHDLERTALRLILPGIQHLITGTSVEDDIWSLGLDFHGSLIGLKPTSLAGYQFRWWCTNGATENLASTGTFSRRGSSEDDALAWAKKAVDEILGGLENTFDDTQELVGQIVGEEVVPVVKGLFREFSIAAPERKVIMEALAATTGEMPMYDLQAAITETANRPGLHPDHVARLMEMGGHLIHYTNGTCPTCHQLAPEGFEPESNEAGVTVIFEEQPAVSS